MRVAFFDPFSGASGDMILGALVDVGFPLEELVATVDGLGLPALGIRAEEVHRHGLRGTQVPVHAFVAQIDAARRFLFVAHVSENTQRGTCRQPCNSSRSSWRQSAQ